MTRKTRNLIIAVVLLTLAIAALVVFKYLADRPSEDEKIPAVERPEKLTDFSLGDLRRVELTNPSGNLKLTSPDGETWLISDTPEFFRTVPDNLLATIQTLASLRPIETITDSLTDNDLADYGLNQPAATATLMDKNGLTVTVEFGSQSPTGSGRYARITDSQRLSLISSYAAQTAFTKPADYRDMSLPQPNTEKITHIELRHNGQVFRSQPRSEENPFVGMVSESDVVSPWRGRYPLDDYKLRTLLTEETPLPSTVREYLDEFSPDNPELGLVSDAATSDVSDFIYIQDADGTTLSLIIGASDGSGHRYARLGDRDDAVFLLNDSDIAILYTDPFELISKFVFLASIDAVSQVKVTDGTNQYLMERIQRGDIDDTKDDLFKVNSLEVPQKEFSAAYQKFIGIMWEGVATEDVRLGKSDIVITASHVDSGIEPAVIRFWNYDDVYYLAAVDGQPLEFLVGRYQVTDFIEDIAALSEYAS